MSTRVFLVRHGATDLSAEDRFAGVTEIPISTAGVEQVQALARRLSSESIAGVFSSPRLRTMQTATILGEPHSLEPQAVDGLEEISHGRWEGLTRAEVEERFPDEYAWWENDPFNFAPIGGETGLAVTARALPTLLDLVNRYAEKQIIVVSHKATIRLLLSALLGFDSRTYRDRLDQSPAALNVLDFRDPTRARLALYNDTAHCSQRASLVADPPKRRLSKWWDKRSGS